MRKRYSIWYSISWCEEHNGLSIIILLQVVLCCGVAVWSEKNSKHSSLHSCSASYVYFYYTTVNRHFFVVFVVIVVKWLNLQRIQLISAAAYNTHSSVHCTVLYTGTVLYVHFSQTSFCHDITFVLQKVELWGESIDHDFTPGHLSVPGIYSIYVY